MRILLIEDEEKTLESLRQGLGENGWTVETASEGHLGFKKALEQPFDVIVSDVLMPGMNGVELCRALRNEGIRTPILMLSALGETDDKVGGLEAGADDYLTKPFEFREFVARINALVRRRDEGYTNSRKVRIADLEVDLDVRSVKRAGKDLKLTPREFELLVFFMENRGKVLSKAEIASKVWDIDFDTGTNVVEVYVNYLRNKVDKGYDRALIHTQFGMGYIFKEG